MGKNSPSMSKIDQPVVWLDECKFCVKNIINQLFVRLHQQIHSVLERWIPSREQAFCLCWCTCSVVHDGKDLSIFVWSPAVNAVRVIVLTNHGPSAEACLWTKVLHTNLLLLSLINTSAEACLWTEVLHTNLLLLSLINKFMSLGCQLKTYPWPRPIDCESSGCNSDFAIFNNCEGNTITSKKTKHSSAISIHGGSGL